jgi:hypothetical protein
MEFVKQEFESKSWKQETDTKSQQTFVKGNSEFSITKKHNVIYVSTPLKSSQFNYETTFENDDFNAIHSYIVDKLQYIES